MAPTNRQLALAYGATQAASIAEALAAVEDVMPVRRQLDLAREMRDSCLRRWCLDLDMQLVYEDRLPVVRQWLTDNVQLFDAWHQERAHVL